MDEWQLWSLRVLVGWLALTLGYFLGSHIMESSRVTNYDKERGSNDGSPNRTLLAPVPEE